MLADFQTLYLTFSIVMVNPSSKHSFFRLRGPQALVGTVLSTQNTLLDLDNLGNEKQKRYCSFVSLQVSLGILYYYHKSKYLSGQNAGD